MHAGAMAQSLSQVLLHVIFSTKDRQPFLRDLGLREEMHRYLAGILGNLKCQPLLIGGVADHVHLLFSFTRVKSIADVIKETKRCSSIWIKEQDPAMSHFEWQGGYGAFSIGYSQVKSVRAYISEQEEHHRKVTFQDEFRRFLKRYEIEYDERYVWD
jgi:putative transposase